MNAKEVMMLRTILGTFFTTLIFIILISLVPSIEHTTKDFRKSFSKLESKHAEIESPKLKQNSFIVDAKGSVLSEIYSDVNRVYLTNDKIPQLIKEIFVITEDRQFYSHQGLDYLGTLRAFAVNLNGDRISQGGSTITQQLARGLYLSNERTYQRKIHEIYIARELERTFSKEKILELYINNIYYMNGAYGIEAASRQYFNKSVAQLTIAQSAFISSIPNNPTLYDPYVNFNNTQSRQKRILKQLFDFKKITKQQYESALKEKIVVTKHNRIDSDNDYNSYVNHELRLLILEKYASGKKLTLDERDKLLNEKYKELLETGIKVYTAYDKNAQQVARKSLVNNLPYKDVEGSLAIINHDTQKIVGLIGGKNISKFGFNRAYQAYRQPGSTIKPLLVYAPYINITGNGPLSKVSADKFCKAGYCPKNYSNKEYGMVTLETALKHSYNTPAVRLLDEIGVSTAFSYLNHFGWEKVSSQDHNLSAAIGGFGYGVTSLELTSAYTVFSHNGTFIKPRAITRVTDLNGKTLLSWSDKPKTVWNVATNEKLNLMLKKVITEGTGRRANLPIVDIGGKTGTTNDYHDLWFVGKGNTYTIGVWIGKDNSQSIEYLNGSQPQIKIWRDIMTNLELK
ncbi:MAG: penicillin-binding protein [Bacillales bacterium]|jgi:penicillin-binding protein 1A|nr:penicillin-binding protein [Bacillales bacterium]